MLWQALPAEKGEKDVRSEENWMDLLFSKNDQISLNL
jgi:hypothetical protein